ncbi:MAG: single-stranded-DNA-specific exonuclease RecJ [Lachnospiraceae bacterium]|nr:single-stranded-DNA-specific exonuclease RecJ [Lachnospiraceae bacterium]
MANWYVASKRADFDAIAKTYNIDPVLARVIRNRDITTPEEIRKYLCGTLEDLYDPGLLDGCEEAAKLIKEQISQSMKMRVIGDYDVDGVCSAFMFTAGLRSLGAEVDNAIPHRINDGYGLNAHLVEQAKEDGIQMLLTCDNGIAAAEQIKLAKSYGMTVIVTDHHEVPFEKDASGKKHYILPEADVVIDPHIEGSHYPNPGICGAVVVYKLLQVLGVDPELMDQLLEFAAFATECDVMQLQDENRIIEKEGLKRIRHTKNPGLKALIHVNQIDPSSIQAYHLGFILGPCVNASGRLDTAKMALELFECRSFEEAVPIANQLKALNDERKELTEHATQVAMDQVEKELSGDRVLVVYLPDCHESVAGIVAGRVREHYYKPSIVLTKTENGLKGSGRSIESYNLHEELTRVSHLFTQFGGHKMAAGMSLPEENLETFRREINDNCTLTEEEMTEKIVIDVPMPLSYVTMDLVRQMDVLEPFGNGNPKPVFAQKDLEVIDLRVLGQNRRVVKIQASTPDRRGFSLTWFGDGDAFVSEVKKGDSLSVLYYPNINTFRGEQNLEFVISGYKIQ